MTMTDSGSGAYEAGAPDAGGPARRRLRIGVADLVSYGCYLVGALWVTGHLWRGVSSRVLLLNQGDHTQFEWMLAHAARLFSHPENPFFSASMNVPDGVNLMANTSALGMTVPLAPVTLLWGPAVGFAVMLTLALWLTASAWYYVFSRHLVRSRFAAFAGGVVCGFAPALVAHASGQPNLVAQFTIPFIVLTTLRLADKPVRRGILLGLLVVYQVFVNEEVLFFFGLATVLLVLLYAAFDPARTRRDAGRFLTGVAVALAAAVPLLAFPLYWQFLGRQAYHGLPFAPSSFVQDLQAYVTYAKQSIGGGSPSPALNGSSNEQNSSFGWPLLVLGLLVTVYLWRRSRLVRAAVLTGVVYAALSLGPTVVVGGRVTSLPGPFRLLTHVPLVDLTVPSRYALVVVPVLGMLLALGVQEAIEVMPRMRAAGVPWAVPLWVIVLLGAVVPMLPTPVPTIGRAPVPAFIASGQWRQYVPAGRTLVPVPLPGYRAPDALLWQASAGLGFAIPRGYFLGPTGPGNKQARFGAPQRPTAVKLYAVSVLPGEPRPYADGDTPIASVDFPARPTDVATLVTAADRQAALADLRFWRAAVVVLPPGYNEELLWRTVTNLLGFQPVWVGGLWLWDVRELVH
jgi:hypothetical protein